MHEILLIFLGAAAKDMLGLLVRPLLRIVSWAINKWRTRPKADRGYYDSAKESVRLFGKIRRDLRGAYAIIRTEMKYVRKTPDFISYTDDWKKVQRTLHRSGLGLQFNNWMCRYLAQKALRHAKDYQRTVLAIARARGDVPAKHWWDARDIHYAQEVIELSDSKILEIQLLLEELRKQLGMASEGTYKAGLEGLAQNLVIVSTAYKILKDSAQAAVMESAKQVGQAT